MRVMPLLIISTAILLAACSSAPEPRARVRSAAEMPSATTADAPSAKTADAGTGSTTDPDHQVCKVTRIIGSNLSHKVCRSAAQIERDRERSREEMSEQQRGR